MEEIGNADVIYNYVSSTLCLSIVWRRQESFIIYTNGSFILPCASREMEVIFLYWRSTYISTLHVTFMANYRLVRLLCVLICFSLNVYTVPDLLDLLINKGSLHPLSLVLEVRRISDSYVQYLLFQDVDHPWKIFITSWNVTGTGCSRSCSVALISNLLPIL